MPLETGEVAAERYRVAKLLGQGGMGAVYRAWDTRLNRPVALKEMFPQSGLDDSLLAQLRSQFQQEAQVLGTLIHPNLVRVTDYFSWDGNEYLVMDFVEGESLAERIQRDGAQSEEQVVAWVGQLLEGLAYCHERGVLHRDIKPQNIIVTSEGRAVLVDFGLVKLWDPQDPHTRTVMRGAGTPEYAPPEQYDLGPGHTDPRSDVYSLGAMTYHALTGQIPPTATQRMATPSCFVAPHSINPAVSPAIEEIILKALAIAMEWRFQSAAEMAQALGFAQRTSPVTPPLAPSKTRPVPPADQDQPTAERKRVRLLGLGGVSLALVGALCLTLTVGGVLVGSSIWGPDTGSDRANVAKDVSVSSTPPPLATQVGEPLFEGNGDILFEDDFDSPTSGWETGDYETGSVGYDNGIYYVTALGNKETMWGVAHRSFDDLVIDVRAAQVSAPTNNNNSYGVVCREQGNGDGYYLLISGDGYYAIGKTEGSNFEWLVDWAESDVIQPGSATNLIRAVCDGSTLALFVNDQPLATAEDDTFTEGDIALTATSYEDARTKIKFDTLVVRTP